MKSKEPYDDAKVYIVDENVRGGADTMKNSVEVS